MTTPVFNFPISFVTATNQVVKVFPIGRYFLMFDSMGALRVEKVQDDYDAVLNESLKNPMEKIAVWS